ncbi:MAG TPA: hypothetical protein VFW29_06835 [Solirubrobacteraceae bacterium]|nr:hypothetical protein [Solirubrobacteraceae bacterium]
MEAAQAARRAEPTEQLAARRRRARRRRLVAIGAALACGVVAGGCSTGQPGPIGRGDLAEAQTFPYFRVYWVGRIFEGHQLAAVDGLKGYIASIGDSVYYGDCIQSKGIFGGGSCQLPLQVTTVLYHVHSNKALGSQRNILVRGVPGVVYDQGHSIELYTGRVAIDIFADTFDHALTGARLLRPVNAPGSANGNLPAPVFCPGLYGATEPAIERVMQSLPGQACQRAESNEAFKKAVQSY